jgi:hypothetical protein
MHVDPPSLLSRRPYGRARFIARILTHSEAKRTRARKKVPG